MLSLRWNSVVIAQSGEDLPVPVANDAADDGGAILLRGGCGRDGADVEAGNLQGVEESARVVGLDVAGDEGGKEQRDGELNRVGVLQRGEVEGRKRTVLGQRLAILQQILHGFRTQGSGLDRRCCPVTPVKRAMEVTEGAGADGTCLTAVSVGLDVSTDESLAGLGVHGVPFWRLKCGGPQVAFARGGRLAALLI